MIFPAAMLAMPAFALDIDRIEVKSRLGEPLLAEIPIVSGTPEELKALQAGLASPVTFARVGLPRPQGVVSGLRFTVVRNARGRPVIRISSAMPVEQDFFSFLIQLDWGAGQMVREYSVALQSTLPPPLPVALAASSLSVPAPPSAASSPELPPAAAATPVGPAMEIDPAAVESPSVPSPSEVAPIPMRSAPILATPEPAPIAPPVATPTAKPAAAKPIPLAQTPAARIAPKRIPPSPAQPIALAQARSPASRTIAPVTQPIPPVQRTTSQISVAQAPITTSKPQPIPAASSTTMLTPAANAATRAASVSGEYGPVKAGENLSRIAARVGGDRYSADQVMLALLRANPDAFAYGNINQLKRGAVLRVPQSTEISQFDAAQAAALVREQTSAWQEGRLTETPPIPAVETPAVSTPIAADAVPIVPTRAAAPMFKIAPISEDIAARLDPKPGIGTSGNALSQSQQQAASGSTDAEIERLKARLAELEAREQAHAQQMAIKDRELAASRPAYRMTSWFLWIAAFGGVFLFGWGLARRRSASRPMFDTASTNQESAGSGPASTQAATEPEPAARAGQLPHSPTWHAGMNAAAGDAALSAAPADAKP